MTARPMGALAAGTLSAGALSVSVAAMTGYRRIPADRRDSGLL